MDAANTAAESGQAGDAPQTQIACTWASTSADPAKRERLGKVYAATGKWPVTPGVKRQAFVFESAHYADLEALAVDLRARMKDGGSALVAGRLKLLPRLIDRRKAHRRTAENFADFPCWVLFLDFDGLTATKAGMRIDRPEDFGEAALEEALKLLPAAFDADHIVYATSSSGLPRNAKGEPANGRAWFRLAFWLKRPLTFAEQKQIVLALQQLPGLQCLDVAIYAIPQFNFITRPDLPAGMDDPIEKPVLLCKGALRQVDVDALLTEIGVTLTSKQRPGPRPPAGEEERRLAVAPELRVPLTRQAVAAIVNDLDRIDWVHFAHAIDGSLDGDPAGRDIFLKFSARWMEETDPEEEDDFEWVEGETDPEEGTDPEEEAERVWDTRGEGRAGFGYLMRLLEKQGTPEAEAAIFAIRQAQAAARQAQAAAAFPDPPPDHDDDDDDDDALLARRAPTIDPRAFYGPLDKIVTETTKDSEATKVGVAAQIIAHVSLTLRPFYNPLGNGKVSFNVYFVQLGPSGKGRKGTSAAIADDFLGPALLRLAQKVRTRIAFPDEVESARDEAEAAVEEAARKLSWTRSVRDFQDSEIEAGLAMLRQEHAAATREIAERKARLKVKARAYRTVREQEKLIAAAEAKRADIARLIAADEAELTEVRRVLKDRKAALAQAEATHDAAQAKLDGLPSPGPPPAAWLGLFASLADGPVTTTGVSTGEGLIELIRDPGRKQGLRGPVDDPGVDNKCLFLNLDELGSVLAVIMRPGATLSSVLRTMWDCRKTELVNKNSPTRCKEPYVTMSASITPGELMGRLFDKRDAASSADNGLGNRLLYLWVKRDKLKARPLATPGLDAMMDTIAGNVLSVYGILKPDRPFLSTPIDFSPEAYQRYEREYPRIANLKAAGRNAAKLIERLPVYLRKFAAILAVINGEAEISAGALEAAIAWVEYAAGTVDAIAATAAERKKTRVLADDGETILAALKALGGDTKPVSSREVPTESSSGQEAL